MAKYAQNGFRMHLLQSRISKFSEGGPVPSSYQGGGLKPPSLVGSPPPENFEILDCRRCILRPF